MMSVFGRKSKRINLHVKLLYYYYFQGNVAFVLLRYVCKLEEEGLGIRIRLRNVRRTQADHVTAG